MVVGKWISSMRWFGSGFCVGWGWSSDFWGVGKRNCIKCLKSEWNEKSGGEITILKWGLQVG